MRSFAFPEPAARSARVRGLLKALPVVIILMSTLLAFNGLQVLSVLVYPVSPGAFRRFNRWAANTWWGWCVRTSRWMNGVELLISGDDIPAAEDAIVVLNHQQMSDVTFLMDFAYRKDRLGDMKWVVKDVIKYVPGVGWGMLFINCVFVKRQWARDRDSIRRTFATLREERLPVWFISFPEGTRLTLDKLARSQAYASKQGLKALQHVLVPRTKGFVAAVQGLREHVTAIYDVTFGYPDGAPSLWQFIKGYGPRAHLHVRRFAIGELPEGDEALAAWLLERFEAKDSLLDAFHAQGAFPEDVETRTPA